MGSHLLLYLSLVIVILINVGIVVSDRTQLNSQAGLVPSQSPVLPLGGSAWRVLSTWLRAAECWEEAEAREGEEQIGLDYSLLSEAGLFAQDVGG